MYVYLIQFNLKIVSKSNNIKYEYRLKRQHCYDFSIRNKSNFPITICPLYRIIEVKVA